MHIMEECVRSEDLAAGVAALSLTCSDLQHREQTGLSGARPSCLPRASGVVKNVADHQKPSPSKTLPFYTFYRSKLCKFWFDSALPPWVESRFLPSGLKNNFLKWQDTQAITMTSSSIAAVSPRSVQWLETRQSSLQSQSPRPKMSQVEVLILNSSWPFSTFDQLPQAQAHSLLSRQNTMVSIIEALVPKLQISSKLFLVPTTHSVSMRIHSASFRRDQRWHTKWNTTGDCKLKVFFWDIAASLCHVAGDIPQELLKLRPVLIAEAFTWHWDGFEKRCTKKAGTGKTHERHRVCSGVQVHRSPFLLKASSNGPVPVTLLAFLLNQIGQSDSHSLYYYIYAGIV